MEGRGSLSARFAFQRSLPAAKCAGLTKAFLSPPGPAAAARMASRRRGLMHTRTVCPAPGPCIQPETSEQPLWEEKLPLKWRPPQKKPPLHQLISTSLPHTSRIPAGSCPTVFLLSHSSDQMIFFSCQSYLELFKTVILILFIFVALMSHKFCL